MNLPDIVQQLLYPLKVTAKIFVKHWIAVFGAPKTVFSDNGGKFTGESFVEMHE